MITTKENSLIVELRTFAKLIGEEELQAIVGGLIDCQMTNDGNDLIIFNDEGKLMELPYNENVSGVV